MIAHIVLRHMDILKDILFATAVIESSDIDTLTSLLVCSKGLHEYIQSLPPCLTPTLGFMKARYLCDQCKIVCPNMRRDWRPENPVCGSPLCHNITGPWVPSRHDNLPGPCNDAIHGSKSLEDFMEWIPNVRGVACSLRCWLIMREIKWMTDELDTHVIGVWLYKEPFDALRLGLSARDAIERREPVADDDFRRGNSGF